MSLGLRRDEPLIMPSALDMAGVFLYKVMFELGRRLTPGAEEDGAGLSCYMPTPRVGEGLERGGDDGRREL